MIKAKNNGENQQSFTGTEELVAQVVAAVVVVVVVALVIAVVLANDCFFIALLTFVKASVSITAMHIRYNQSMEAGETAQDTESFKSKTCSGATLARRCI